MVEAYIITEEDPVVDADNSSSTWTDNEDGTGTMELIVHDQFDEPMTGFGMDDIEIFYYDDETVSWTLATLDGWPAWIIDLFSIAIPATKLTDSSSLLIFVGRS